MHSLQDFEDILKVWVICYGSASLVPPEFGSFKDKVMVFLRGVPLLFCGVFGWSLIIEQRCGKI